uniref:SCAN box domain-containing protein n=1 Tax=Pygocentrus nattereri TaxID=42514 RepID=A0AAR2J536_PYGNA
MAVTSASVWTLTRRSPEKPNWALHLIPLLEGKARAAYVAMDAEDACDYQKVKSAVLRKYEINKETYRQRFRDCAVRANETPRELYTRLKGLYEKWMTPREITKEQIGDTIIMEQDLKMVNPELHSWLIERSPISTDQAVTLAEAYIAARQAEGKFWLGDLSTPRYSCEPGKLGDGYGSGSKPQVFRSSTQGYRQSSAKN